MYSELYAILRMRHNGTISSKEFIQAIRKLREKLEKTSMDKRSA